MDENDLFLRFAQITRKIQDPELLLLGVWQRFPDPASASDTGKHYHPNIYNNFHNLSFFIFLFHMVVP